MVAVTFPQVLGAALVLGFLILCAVIAIGPRDPGSKDDKKPPTVYLLIAVLALTLPACGTTPEPWVAVRAEPVSTAALGVNLDKASTANQSAAAKAARMRDLIREDNELLKSFP